MPEVDDLTFVMWLLDRPHLPGQEAAKAAAVEHARLVLWRAVRSAMPMDTEEDAQRYEGLYAELLKQYPPMTDATPTPQNVAEVTAALGRMVEKLKTCGPVAA